jgi:hypothetical protein
VLSVLREGHEARTKEPCSMGRNAAYASIRGLYDIYLDRMQRVKYNREHPADKNTIKRAEEYEIDSKIAEDE